MSMGLSTLHASNIKGFVFEFARTRPVWIGPKYGFRSKIWIVIQAFNPGRNLAYP